MVEAAKSQNDHVVYDRFELFGGLGCLSLRLCDRRTLFDRVAGFDVMVNRSGVRIGSRLLIRYPLAFSTAVTHYSRSSSASPIQEY